MAKQQNGYLGGFAGRLGTAVGYQWNGKWCLRRMPTQMTNQRTVKQMEHRQAFKEQVQLAACMRSAVLAGLTAEARSLGMTSYNLFVHLNQQAFSMVEGGMQTDWRMLRLSIGPLAPVAFGAATIDEHNTLDVSFEANPMHMRADGNDLVRLYAYCPELGRGYMTAPVYRRSKHISAALPDEFEGKELQLYGFVQNNIGVCSDSYYIEQASELTELQTNDLDETPQTFQADGLTAATVATTEVHCPTPPPGVLEMRNEK